MLALHLQSMLKTKLLKQIYKFKSDFKSSQGFHNSHPPSLFLFKYPSMDKKCDNEFMTLNRIIFQTLIAFSAVILAILSFSPVGPAFPCLVLVLGESSGETGVLVEWVPPMLVARTGISSSSTRKSFSTIVEREKSVSNFF